MADSFPIVASVDLETAWTASSDYHNFDLFPAMLRATIRSVAFVLNDASSPDGPRPALMATLKLRKPNQEEREILWSQPVEFGSYGNFVEFPDRIAIPEYLAALECDLHRTQGDRTQFGTLTIVAWFDREMNDG